MFSISLVFSNGIAAGLIVSGILLGFLNDSVEFSISSFLVIVVFGEPETICFSLGIIDSGVFCNTRVGSSSRFPEESLSSFTFSEAKMVLCKLLLSALLFLGGSFGAFLCLGVKLGAANFLSGILGGSLEFLKYFLTVEIQMFSQIPVVSQLNLSS